MKKMIVLSMILLAPVISLAQANKAKPLPKVGDLLILFPLSGKGNVVTDVNNNLEIHPYNDRDRDNMVFKVNAGLAGGKTVSLESLEKKEEFFVHQNGSLFIMPKKDTPEYKQAASFRLERGAGDDDALSLEVASVPGWFVHAAEGRLDVVPDRPEIDGDTLGFYFQTQKADFIKSQTKLENLKSEGSEYVNVKIEFTGKGKIEVAGQSCAASPCTFQLRKEQGYFTTVVAQPDNLFELKSWGGDCSGEQAICMISLSKDTALSATFFKPRTIMVSVTPPLSGYVRPDYGADCKAGEADDCQYERQVETRLRLWSYPMSTKWSYNGWTGLCSGQPAGYCEVTLPISSKGKTAAQFAENTKPMKKLVVKSNAGNGAGAYVADTHCKDKTCVFEYPQNSKAYIMVMGPKGSAASYTGDCTGSGNSINYGCILVMDTDKSVEMNYRDAWED